MSTLTRAVRVDHIRCGGALAGQPDDAWLLCEPCRVAVSAREPDRELVLCSTSARGFAAGRGVPFFRFAAPQLRADSAAGPARASGVAALPAVWVVGVRIRRFQGYGEVGFEYTRRPPRLSDGARLPALGIHRSLEDARRVGEVSLWRAVGEAGGRTAGADFAARVDLGEPEIWLVPSILDDGLVKLPHCPIRYPAALIEGYA